MKMGIKKFKIEDYGLTFSKDKIIFYGSRLGRHYTMQFGKSGVINVHETKEPEDKTARRKLFEFDLNLSESEIEELITYKKLLHRWTIHKPEDLKKMGVQRIYTFPTLERFMEGKECVLTIQKVKSSSRRIYREMKKYTVHDVFRLSEGKFMVEGQKNGKQISGILFVKNSKRKKLIFCITNETLKEINPEAAHIFAPRIKLQGYKSKPPDLTK